MYQFLESMFFGEAGRVFTIFLFIKLWRKNIFCLIIPQILIYLNQRLIDCSVALII